jgi:hypothetical protein
MKLSLQKTSSGLIPITEKGRAWIANLDPAAVIEANLPDEVIGTVPMLRTWRKWMTETAAEMNRRGCHMPMYVDHKGQPQGQRPMNGDDAHELFTSTYLGVDEQGRRKSWSLSDKEDEVQASMGDRLHAMDTHVQWCLERGIKLTIPRNGEYYKYREASAS